MAVLLFAIPALWLGYLLGRLLQHGLAGLLYYRLADLTPWLLAHWNGLLIVSLSMALMGNAMMTSYIRWGRWSRVMWALPLVVLGSTLWLVVCLLQPDWMLAPFQGLLVFSLLVAGLLGRIMAHYAMGADEIVKVVGWMLVFVGGIAVLQGVMSWAGMI